MVVEQSSIPVGVDDCYRSPIGEVFLQMRLQKIDLSIKETKVMTTTASCCFAAVRQHLSLSFDQRSISVPSRRTIYVQTLPLLHQRTVIDALRSRAYLSESNAGLIDSDSIRHHPWTHINVRQQTASLSYHLILPSIRGKSSW